jgi:hypothetical protein
VSLTFEYVTDPRMRFGWRLISTRSAKIDAGPSES